MATVAQLPIRLHHNAYVTKDQEKTRQFYEDVIGLPLVATWCESDELFGKMRTYVHTFYGIGDGGALAFFQFADPAIRPSSGRTCRNHRFSTSPCRWISQRRPPLKSGFARPASSPPRPMYWSMGLLPFGVRH